MKPVPFTRREFVGGGAAALLAAALEACGLKVETRKLCSGGAVPCREPLNEEERTFLAIADTVVPGCATDPDGLPGAVEGCVLNLAGDPALPVTAFVPLLVTLADEHAQEMFTAPFVELDLDQRTAVLARAERRLPLLSYAFRFFRAAHYAGLYNDLGPRALGYPGGNLGYIDDPDFSFRRPVCRERTPDGNMR